MNGSTQEYSVIIRILPSGKEVEMGLPINTTGKLIKETLLEHKELALPKTGPEGTISYKLTSKGTGKEIADSSTIHESGVNDGDTLLLVPVLIAG